MSFVDGHCMGYRCLCESGLAGTERVTFMEVYV